jgi:hypothetical protein
VAQDGITAIRATHISKHTKRFIFISPLYS